MPNGVSNWADKDPSSDDADVLRLRRLRWPAPLQSQFGLGVGASSARLPLRARLAHALALFAGPKRDCVQYVIREATFC